MGKLLSLVGVMGDRVEINEAYRTYPPAGYVSEQKRANEDREFLLGLLEQKAKEGFEEIDPVELLEEPTDQEFVYINSEGKYCSGGWLRFPRDPNRKEQAKDEMWVMYSARNRKIVSLQLQETVDSPHAVRVFIKREAVGYKRPVKETKYPVFLPDHRGVNQVVYYGSRQMQQERFTRTGKFARAQRYGWYFID